MIDTKSNIDNKAHRIFQIRAIKGGTKYGLLNVSRDKTDPCTKNEMKM